MTQSTLPSDRSYRHAQPYHKRAATNPPIPTITQIETMLRPYRPDVLRALATPGTMPTHFWLRTAYLHPDASAALRTAFLNDEGGTLNDGALILDDAALFDFGIDGAADAGWAPILELLPEIVTDVHGHAGFLQRRDEELRILVTDDDVDDVRDPDNIREQYLFFHDASVLLHMFVEDAVAQASVEDGDMGVLLIWLDYYGQVVRRARVLPEEAELTGLLEQTTWKETIFTCAEVGEAYLAGGISGPPYDYRPEWLKARETAEQTMRDWESAHASG